jgi:hypothetical protein
MVTNILTTFTKSGHDQLSSKLSTYFGTGLK